MLARAPKLELVEAEIEREKEEERKIPCAVLTAAPVLVHVPFLTFITVKRDPRIQSKSMWITRSHLLRARDVDSPRILVRTHAIPLPYVIFARDDARVTILRLRKDTRAIYTLEKLSLARIEIGEISGSRWKISIVVFRRFS